MASFSSMFTCELPSVKIYFQMTEKSTRCWYGKGILYLLEESNDSKLCTRPEQTSRVQEVCQCLFMCSGQSFIAKYNCGKAEKYLLSFKSLFQGRKNLEKPRCTLEAQDLRLLMV